MDLTKCRLGLKTSIHHVTIVRVAYFIYFLLKPKLDSGIIGLGHADELRLNGPVYKCELLEPGTKNILPSISVSHALEKFLTRYNSAAFLKRALANTQPACLEWHFY